MRRTYLIILGLGMGIIGISLGIIFFSLKIKASQQLLNKRWDFVSYNRIPDFPRGKGRILFKSSGEYEFGFCNTISGKFKFDGKIISSSPELLTTTIACLDGKTDKMDNALSHIMTQSPTASIEGNILILTDANGDQFIFKLDEK
jgi:heat shock protein HslJ